jgi:hypothetical protein
MREHDRRDVTKIVVFVLLVFEADAALPVEQAHITEVTRSALQVKLQGP